MGWTLVTYSVKYTSATVDIIQSGGTDVQVVVITGKRKVARIETGAAGFQISAADVGNEGNRAPWCCLVQRKV